MFEYIHLCIKKLINMGDFLKIPIGKYLLVFHYGICRQDGEIGWIKMNF